VFTIFTTKEETMYLSDEIAGARGRQACKALGRDLLAQFGEEVDGWFQPVYELDADGAPEARLTHNGVQIAVWRGNDGIWYVEGEPLQFDWKEEGEAQDALLVAIDDLTPAAVEQVTEV
jgi:hypothetical protein